MNLVWGQANVGSRNTNLEGNLLQPLFSSETKAYGSDALKGRREAQDPVEFSGSELLSQGIVN